MVDISYSIGENMPRITKVYTGKGDSGQTGLSSGETVAKNSVRVNAFGTVDELNSQIGLAIASDLDPLLTESLSLIQNDLFHLGSDLSYVSQPEQVRPIPQIEARHVSRLENLIDDLNEQVGPLENFILPGGAHGAAQLHVARSICRRAERDVITLAGQELVGTYVIAYLNRLSDALFVMARYENHSKKVAEPLWDSSA
jgi:cob(I)alamin adenosyltransferase